MDTEPPVHHCMDPRCTLEWELKRNKENITTVLMRKPLTVIILITTVHAISSVNENKVLWADVAHRNFTARDNLGGVWEFGSFTDFVEISHDNVNRLRTVSNGGHILDRVMNCSRHSLHYGDFS